MGNFCQRRQKRLSKLQKLYYYSKDTEINQNEKYSQKGDLFNYQRQRLAENLQKEEGLQKDTFDNKNRNINQEGDLLNCYDKEQLKNLQQDENLLKKTERKSNQNNFNQINQEQCIQIQDVLNCINKMQPKIILKNSKENSNQDHFNFNNKLLYDESLFNQTEEKENQNHMVIQNGNHISFHIQIVNLKYDESSFKNTQGNKNEDSFNSHKRNLSNSEEKAVENLLKNTEGDQSKKYKKAFKQETFQDCIKKLTNVGQNLIYQSLSLFYLIKNDFYSLGSYEIGAIVLALGYLVSPVDIIPDQIPIIGYLDDKRVLDLVFNQLKTKVTQKNKEDAIEFMKNVLGLKYSPQ